MGQIIDRHLMYTDVVFGVDEIFQRNSVFCNYKVDYTKSGVSDNGRSLFDLSHPVGSRFYEPIEISIGVKSLKQHCMVDGFVRDKDAVWVFVQAFHESAHLWQHVVGYRQQNVSDRICDMARERAICDCFPEYKHTCYMSDLSESFANQYGFEQTKKFIESKAMSNICCQMI